MASKNAEKKSIDDILNESLPQESLFATANKDYDPDIDE